MDRATVVHHSFGPVHTVRRSTMTEDCHNEMNDAMGQMTPPSTAFFRIYDEEDAEQGVRPPCLGEPLG